MVKVWDERSCGKVWRHGVEQYKQSAHGALFDAKALGKICTGSYLHQNFCKFLKDQDAEINWEFHDLLRPSPRTVYLPG